MPDTNYALCVDPRDNVATLFSAGVSAGNFVNVNDKAGNTSRLIANMDIPYAHKIAIRDIQKDEYIYKYGEVIGRASAYIHKGDHVHIHNLESTRARGDLQEGTA